MSGRGVDFVDLWTAANLAGFHQPLPDRGLISRLAARCAAEAGAIGIALPEIEVELGSLETVIREALENNPDDEIRPHMRYGLN